MDIKFFYLPYKPGRYWSRENSKYFYASDIKFMCYEGPNQPAKGKCLDINEICKLEKFTTKETCGAIQLFNSDTFSGNETTSFDKWNGCVFIDLDLKNSKVWSQLSEEKEMFAYIAFKGALERIAPNNFHFIEHSSSGKGMHLIFYYDVEKTEEMHRKCAIYTKNLILSNIDELIPHMKDVLTEDRVWDPVYTRPWQKCFVTGRDYFIREVSGEVDFSDFEYIERKALPPDTAKYEINSFKLEKSFAQWEVPYPDRLKLATALKRVTANEEEWATYWDMLCDRFINTEYSRDKMFKQVHYKALKPEMANLNLLKKYGIEIDRSKIIHNLTSTQFLGDVLPQVLEEIDNGVNILQAGTGVGKTYSWIDLHKKLWNDQMERCTRQPILIVEPYNSIIDTKYEGVEGCYVINKSAKWPEAMTGYGLYVTNYNKLLDNYQNEYMVRPDIEQFLSQFSLIVIDESHVIIKDSFRMNVLVPFTNSIRAIGETRKVILQTATLMDEDKVFQIKHHIKINKPTDKNIKFYFRTVPEGSAFNISDLFSLVDYYEGRKVYIYWSNGELNKLKAFRDLYKNPDRVAIFHKRNENDESMKYIKENHKLGDKYDVLLSSVYFGVGNDLDDEDDAAVIIIGNNTWQEDIQALGRFRKSKDIEVCQIILPGDRRDVEFTAENPLPSRAQMLKDSERKIKLMSTDAMGRKRSIIVAGTQFVPETPEDIRLAAIIDTNNDWYANFRNKIEALSDPFYGITTLKTDYKRELEINVELVALMKDNKAKLAKMRDEFMRDIINGKYDGLEGEELEAYRVKLNEDSKMQKWERVWRKLKRHSVADKLPLAYVRKNSNVDAMRFWCKMRDNVMMNEQDNPEVASLLAYRKAVLADTNKEGGVIGGVHLKPEDYYAILYYIVFVNSKNVGDMDYRMMGTHFSDFKKACKWVLEWPEELVNHLVFADEWDDLNFQIIEEFMGETPKIKKIESFDDFVAGMVHMKRTHEEIEKIAKTCLTIIENVRERRGVHGDKGGRPEQRIIVSDTFPTNKLDKYGLAVGDEFESGKEMASKLNVPCNRISEWVKKGWLTK